MTLSRERGAELLHEAGLLINGERAEQYGEPQESFNAIAIMWSGYLGFPINVHDVAMMMILLKVARGSRGRHKKDNYIDICGYAALAGSDDNIE
jgi:hypothetical protein